MTMRRDASMRNHCRTARNLRQTMGKTTLFWLAGLAWSLASSAITYAQRTIEDQDPVDAKEVRIGEYLTEATRLRTESGRLDPDSDQAKDLERLEALSLFEAAFLGDDTQKTRLDALTTRLRSDTNLEPQLRMEIVAGVENLTVFRNSELSRKEQLDQYEQVARGLVTEFPEVEICYESLWGIALAQSEEEAEAIAKEILQLLLAPGRLKIEAADLIARSELMGQVLADLVSPDEIGTSDLESTRGKHAIIYSWTTTDPFSMWVAGEIVRLAPIDAVIFGLNLDTDTEAAVLAAESGGFVGEQRYAHDRQYVALRRALRISKPALVYVTDSSGVITSLSAQRDLPALLAQSRSQ